MEENKIRIDKAFIEKWHPKYDEIEDDEEEYKSIIDIVSKELSKEGTISKDTFIRILDWKAPRVKGIVKLDKYDKEYKEKIHQCHEAPDDEKMAILLDLYGIGVPIASTILHFMYPESFPIMDIRTVETLYYAKLINSKARSQKNYTFFRKKILNISKTYQKSLREIDRALFAYHKIYLKKLIV